MAQTPPMDPNTSEPPTFMRHDEVNGLRFREPVETDFRGAPITCGAA